MVADDKRCWTPACRSRGSLILNVAVPRGRDTTRCVTWWAPLESCGLRTPHPSMRLHAARRQRRRVEPPCSASELRPVRNSPIVLNRGCASGARGDHRRHLSMSEIAIRCGRVKRDPSGTRAARPAGSRAASGLLPTGAKRPHTMGPQQRARADRSRWTRSAPARLNSLTRSRPRAGARRPADPARRRSPPGPASSRTPDRALPTQFQPERQVGTCRPSDDHPRARRLCIHRRPGAGLRIRRRWAGNTYAAVAAAREERYVVRQPVRDALRPLAVLKYLAERGVQSLRHVLIGAITAT